MARPNRTLVLLLAALAPACGGGGRPPDGPTTPSAPPPAFEAHASANFTFRYTPIDAATVAQTAALVEAQRSRILQDLGVASMSRVTVTLYPDQAALRADCARQRKTRVSTHVGTDPTVARVVALPRERKPASAGQGGMR